MKKIFSISFILFGLMISGCNNSATSGFDDPDIEIEDIDCYVYQNDVLINPIIKNNESYTLSFEGNNIRIEDNKIIPLKASTTTEVTLTTSSNRKETFNVNVINREYESRHLNAETKEGWFEEINVDPVLSMDNEFANGMDISSVKQLYDNGQKFYNKDGIEQSIFQILKESGVNWIRLRLWNQPYDEYEENGVTKRYEYGGGNCTIENISWIAHEAKAEGLNVLLDFHYSDFWADPGKQVIPKEWVDVSTSDELANKVKEFTKESLLILKENDALPDMVSIGNETCNGMFLHNPGPINKTPTGLDPNYISGRTERNNGTEAKYNYTENKDENINLRKYVSAAIDGINEVDPNIEKMIHYVHEFSYPEGAVKYFKVFDDLDIDVFGLSGYSYWHFDNIEMLKNGLDLISSNFKNKQIAIVETSYGFTYEYDEYANNIYSSSGDTSPIKGYETSIHGQAKMIRDITEVVSNLDNGFGVFYWEGAWTPTKNCGWADSASKASWANQALFSYDGKALGSLEVYNKMQNK